MKKAHTHLLLTPLYKNIPVGVIPSIYFLQHPLAVLKTKGKRCIFIQSMSLKLWCFRWEILSIRGHRIQHVAPHKISFTELLQSTMQRETVTSTNPMEIVASNSEYEKAQPIKVLPKQTSFTVSSRSLLFICVKTKIKLLYLLLCLYSWGGGSGTGALTIIEG